MRLDYESAVGAAARTAATPLEFTDQFGTQLTVATDIRGVLLVEPVKELELQGEIQLAAARANHRLQERAKRDSVLGRGPLPGIVVPYPTKP